ncbi:MAG: DUF1150 domain-containing protein [Mangrovicoccus sp.]|nr:DUF1150 domain-containing protein [Mangrovicoccus sp.]
MDVMFDPAAADNAVFNGGDKIVYVRPAVAEDLEGLPDELREQAAELGDLQAVHGPDGQRLALVRDRKLAFSLARQHNFSPVSVH